MLNHELIAHMEWCPCDLPQHELAAGQCLEEIWNTGWDLTVVLYNSVFKKLVQRGVEAPTRQTSQ